jgi:hypothetical protein
MRRSGDGFWPAVRLKLAELKVDPAAAVGDVFPDQSPVVVVVSSDERVFVLDVDQITRGGEYRIGHVEELADASHRYAWGSEIYIGLLLLREERGASIDPGWILREGVEQLSSEMRSEPKWEWLRDEIRSRGEDPWTTRLVESWTHLRANRPPTTSSILRTRGRWAEITTIQPKLLPHLLSHHEEIEWREIDEDDARRVLGAHVDAVLSLELEDG